MTAPESLYLWRIAVLEARVDCLQRRVEAKDRDLQHVVDRYEGLLAERAAGDGELLADGGDSVPRDGAADGRDGVPARLLARLRSVVG